MYTFQKSGFNVKGRWRFSFLLGYTSNRISMAHGLKLQKQAWIHLYTHVNVYTLGKNQTNALYTRIGLVVGYGDEAGVGGRKRFFVAEI